MVSPHGKTAGSREWLRRRVDKLFECPEVMRMLEAITALRDERRCGFDLSRELTTYACMAVSPHQGRPEFLSRYWARGTGKTWKALAEFPDRLEKIADDVKIINRADLHFYARRRGNDLSRFELLRLQENCMQLPLMIRDYAKALRERNAAVAAATPRSGRSNGLFQLTEHVNWMSGAYHDKEVSELLNTVSIALGEQKQFDAIAIAQARARFKKKKT